MFSELAPLQHGTCQYDGTCLCHGNRRLQEGTYAMRLTRDPFFLERGIHRFEVRFPEVVVQARPRLETTNHHPAFSNFDC